MPVSYKDAAIKKNVEMPKEQVSKVLIFMAGMEAEKGISEPAKEDSKDRKGA